MRILVLSGVIILICLSIAGAAYAQEGAETAKEAQKEAPFGSEKKAEPEPDKSVTKTDEQFEKDRKEWNTTVGGILGTLFTAAGKGIYDVALRDHGFRYGAYPYSRKDYAFYDPELKLRGAPGVFRLEYQRINSKLYGLTWRLTLRMGSGFDASVVGTLYDEKTRVDDHARWRYSRLRLSYLRSPASSNILIRSGGGWAQIGDWSGPEFGLEVDIFPHEPFTGHLGYAQIFPINHSSVSEYDFAVGLMAGPFEFMAGYRGLVTKHDSIDGVYFSAGFWF